MNSGFEAPGTAVLLRCPCPSLPVAERIGAAAIAQRCAASVHLQSEGLSIYRWQGEVARGREVVAIFTTTAEALGGLAALIRAEHPYDTPALTWSLCSADAATAEWARVETGVPAPARRG